MPDIYTINDAYFYFLECNPLSSLPPLISHNHSPTYLYSSVYYDSHSFKNKYKLIQKLI